MWSEFSNFFGVSGGKEDRWIWKTSDQSIVNISTCALLVFIISIKQEENFLVQFPLQKLSDIMWRCSLPLQDIVLINNHILKTLGSFGKLQCNMKHKVKLFELWWLSICPSKRNMFKRCWFANSSSSWMEEKTEGTTVHCTCVTQFLTAKQFPLIECLCLSQHMYLFMNRQNNKIQTLHFSL